MQYLEACLVWGCRQRVVAYEVGVFAILALIGFKSTYAIQDETAASSSNA
jgi:hypothetical protein